MVVFGSGWKSEVAEMSIKFFRCVRLAVIHGREKGTTLKMTGVAEPGSHLKLGKFNEPPGEIASFHDILSHVKLTFD